MVGFHGKGKTRSSTCSSIQSLVKAGRLTERGHISGFPSSIICSDSPFLSFHPSSSSPSQKSAGESDWRVLQYCFPLLLFCVQSKMRTNRTGNKCDWMECNYCKQMKIGQSTFNNFESGVQRKTAKLLLQFSLCFLFHCAFFFTMFSFSLLTNLTMLFSVSEVWCNVFVFFNACSDKIDITLIYLFFSLKKVHETSPGRCIIYIIQCILWVFLPKFIRHIKPPTPLSGFHFLVNCCFWLHILQFICGPQSWVRGIWKNDTNIGITWPDEVHHLQLLKWKISPFISTLCPGSFS